MTTKIRFALASLLLLISTSSFAQQKTLSASMGRIRLDFVLNENDAPTYSVYFAGKEVIKPSAMGFNIENSVALHQNMELTSSTSTSKDDTWKPVWGEVSSIRNHYNQLTIHLREKKEPFRLLDIVFKVFEDGVGFRYQFPKQPNMRYFTVMDELTTFNQTGNHKTFWIPGDYDTNEYTYNTTKLSEVDAWPQAANDKAIAVRDAPDQYAVQTPLMMKTSDNLYINIHEAALVNYPAMQLHVDRSSYSLSANLVPNALGAKAYLRTPFHTPWRTIIISDKAADILASKMILNLNEPSTIANTSWIKPMKFVGVWWEMQTGKASWSYSDFPDSTDAAGKMIPHGHHGANTANVKRYIDFAAKNGIKGVLVEGWNTGWEDWFGNWKEDVFDFVTPYPDFDVKEIRRYAASKGVNMIMHNETSGSVTNYERYMDTAFRFMNNNGYTSVKTGYVGRIIPRGEHHDGQWMANHYIHAAQKAAKYKIMIDMHEPVRPTGLQRTYPNWLANEAGRGNEFNAFSTGNLPEHETIMPFTRLMGGPMDYTPGIFKLRNYTAQPSERVVHTTLCKQLALYITMYSPLAMAADYPENYEAHMDAFQFIKDVPVDWDDSKIIEAEPGDYITIARKEKGKANWYIGAITDENSRTSTVSLSFLDKGKTYTATIYADAANADWKTNPEAYKITSKPVDSNSVLILPLASGGGCAVSIVEKK